MHINFEAWLTYLLAVILVNPSVQQENDLEKMTPGTSGLGLKTILRRAVLNGASSKTLTDMSLKDSGKSSPTWLTSDIAWKAHVKNQRGEYLARKKSAHHTKENGYLFWPTASVPNGGRSPKGKISKTGVTEDGKKRQVELAHAVNWPTPNTCPDAPNKNANIKNGPKNFKEGINWPTVTVNGNNNSASSSMKAGDGLATAARNGQVDQENNSMNGKNRESWPTPVLQDYRGSDQPNRQGGQSLPQVIGKLNPNWVEHLMDVETGWTALDYSVMG
jgi:hypothetical protein